MSLFSFLAPPSTESDEELVNRRVRDIEANKNVRDAVRDLVPLAREFSWTIGGNGTRALVNCLSIFKNDDEMMATVLKILIEVVHSKSESNASGIFADSGSFLNIFECLTHTKLIIRGLSLTLIKNLSQIQPEQLQTMIFDNPDAQELLLTLIEDTNELIESNFLSLIPNLVRNHSELQKSFAFHLFEVLAERVGHKHSSQIFVVLTSLIEGNLQTQRLFVETGHLNRIVTAVKRGDDHAVQFLLTLFSSSDAPSFRNFVKESGLMDPVIEQSVSHRSNRGMFWRLLGIFVKGNMELSAIVNEKLNLIVTSVIQSQEDRENGLYLIDCYSVKEASELAKCLCQSLGQLSSDILNEFATKQNKVVNLLSCARSCVISNRDTLSLFFMTLVSSDKSFLSHAIEIVKSGNDLLVIPAIQFLAACVWESETTVEKVVESLSNEVLRMCDTNGPLRGTANFLALEIFLFKTEVSVFSSFIQDMKKQTNFVEMTEAVDQYLHSISDASKESLWSVFVRDSLEVIRKSVRGENVDEQKEQNLLLEPKTFQEEESQSILEKVDGDRTVIAGLESQVKELSEAVEAYEHMLSDNQEAMSLKDEENARLTRRVAELEAQINVNDTKPQCNQIKNEFSGEDRQTELNSLRREVKELQKQVTALENENMSMKEQICELEDAARARDINQDALEVERQVQESQDNSELSHIQMQLQEKERNLAIACDELARKDEFLQKLNQEIEQLKDQLKAYEGKEITYKSTINDMTSQLKEKEQELESSKELQNRNNDLLLQIEQMRVENREALEALKQESSVKLFEVVQELKDQIKEKDMIIEQLQKQSMEMATEKENLSNEFRQQEAFLLEYKSRLDESESVRLEMENRVVQVEKLNSTLNQQILEKEDEIKKINLEVDKKNNELIELSGKLAEKDKEMIETVSKLSNTEDFHLKYSEASEKIEALERELSSKIEEIETLNGKILTTNQNLEEKEMEIREFERKINEIELSSCQIDQGMKADELETENSKSEEKLTQLELENKDLKSKLEEQEYTIDTLRKQYQDHELELITAHEAKIANLTNEIAKAKSEVFNLRRTVSDLEQEIHESSSVIRDLTVRNRDLTKINESKAHLESLLQTLTATAEEKEANNQQLQQKIDDISLQNSELHHKLEESISQTTAQQQQIETLNLRVAHLTEKLTKYKDHSDLSKFTTRIAALEDELRIVREEDLNLQKKHQSALRLIGELWNRNQALLSH